MHPLELPDTAEGWTGFLVSRCDDQLDVVRRTADLIATEPADRDVTLSRWNEVALALLNATNAAALVSQAHPDEAVRDRADRAEQAAAALGSEIRLDRRLYDALAAVDANGLDPTAVRMLEMTLRDFRRAGVDQDDEIRARLHWLSERETTLSQTFERHVNDDVRSISIDPEQLTGLPEDYVAGHPVGDDGRVVISTDYPDALPFRSFAHDAAARRALLVEFDNRAWPANDEILHELLEIRAERARLLGYASAPDYDAEIKMIGSGAAIEEFVERLFSAADPAARREVEALHRRQLEDDAAAERLSWADLAYYLEAVRREQFGVDAQEVRRYFDFPAVRAGLLDVTGRLFGLAYTPVDTATWHEDVSTYDVGSEGVLLGRIHLDLHPRAGKFKHAAHFPLVKGIEGVQLPQSTLLCNLPRGLISHDDVVTLFHEFGHLLHALLGGHQTWARFSGVATERDFIEAPSQMLEEWAWNAAVLGSFARDSSGTAIPADLVGRMRAANAFGRGCAVAVQLAYTAISSGLHTDVPDDITEYVDAVTARHLPFTSLPGTHKHASFGHLADPGYASAYYTYLWSLVISKDLFSVFDPADLFDPETAGKYRDVVLARGGSRDARDLVEEFVGRPMSTEAFDRWLAGS